MVLGQIKKNAFKASNIFVIVAFLVFFVPLFSWADTPKIAITPLIFEFTGEPGESSEGVIRVSNHSESASARIIMEIEDMFPEGEEGRVILSVPQEERKTFSLSHWIRTEPSEFILEPGKEQKVDFVIDIPEDAEPGGYYVSVVAGTHGITPEGTGVAVRTRIGALILMIIPGEVEEKVEVVSFSAPFYSESGPINFLARFENKGTVHTIPETTVTIINMFGRQVGEINLIGGRILPSAIRKFEAEWDQKWLLGRYRAVLSGTYGSYKKPIEQEIIDFWVFPWKIALMIFFVLLFFFLTRKRWQVAMRILIRGESGLSKKQPKI